MTQNQLAREKSPYLRQHASNPVDWYPWSEEAFSKAIQEDKPIFLSIGYSTCHWCHVMERESFEDRGVATLMNEVFISIKVDREERPDIDNVYMKVCQLMTGGGGWPLTILMTPEKKPFFAGTYIPRKGRVNQVGMLELVPRVGDLWKKRRHELFSSADKIIDVLKQQSMSSESQPIGEKTLDLAYQQFAQSFDTRNAGFGRAPKFPAPHTLLFLLRYWKRRGNNYALEMVEKTLQAMRKGGIFDHIGYGFHRYATDNTWLLPHFEKMIYDQALLIMAYAEAYQATKKSLYKNTAEEIITYVLRDMTSSEGAFFSAEDADSEGEEGKFYTWSWEEIQDELNAEEAQLAVELFTIKKDGNFVEESTGVKSGVNIPHQTLSLEELAAQKKMPQDHLENLAQSVRKKMLALREQRIHPLKDTKILTDWNGLMIASLSKASQAFNQPDLAAAAARAADFILGTLRQPDGGLWHRHCDGESKTNGFADDYAFMIWGLIELYEATFNERYLRSALELNQYVIRHFWDMKKGGLYFTPEAGETLFIREKESYDGAAPSSNSVAMLNFLRLGRMTSNSSLEDKAGQISAFFARNVSAHSSGYAMMLSAASFALGPSQEVIISGKAQAQDTALMLKSLREEFLPNKVILFIPDEPGERSLHSLAPFTVRYKSLGQKATAYVCSNYACQKPTTDIHQMRASLGITD
jgi:uncharacterized protein YyaL (SSP411 family)